MVGITTSSPKTINIARGPMAGKGENVMKNVAKTMAKFKVGDIIVANKKSNERYVITTEKNGWTGKVTSAPKNGEISVKTLTPERHKGEVYTVEEAYFDIEENGQIITQIVNENAIIVKLYDGRKGVAKCSPSGKFNLAFGTALAVARAYGDKETEAKLLAEPVKEEPKFKVRELVRIRQWDDMVKEFGTNGYGSVDCNCSFTDAMKPLCGKYAEIVRLDKDGRVGLKLFNCDDLNTNWGFHTDMLEKV